MADQGTAQSRRAGSAGFPAHRRGKEEILCGSQRPFYGLQDKGIRAVSYALMSRAIAFSGPQPAVHEGHFRNQAGLHPAFFRYSGEVSRLHNIIG